MEYEFPDRPVTAEVVRDWVETRRATPDTCPLCHGGPAAYWQAGQQTQNCYICVTCQRFVLSWVSAQWFKGDHKDRTDVRDKRREWSELAANAHEPPVF